MPAQPTQKVGKLDGLSGWHPEDVKAAIRKRGHTLSSLSRLHGYSAAYLRNAMVRPLYEGEQIIARFLDLPPYAIWPDDDAHHVAARGVHFPALVDALDVLAVRANSRPM